ncbi:hypothetical protein J6G99_05305 [bacterium]|nr:hypothetical protein [bacterium]
MKKILFSLLIVFCGLSAFSAQNFSYTTENTQEVDNYKINETTLKGRVVTVPAGEEFRGIFMAPISSETAYAGQQVTLALHSDFYYNGKEIAPAGSSVVGTVIEVCKARHGTLNGKLTLRFTHIVTPNGLDIPISAVIKTDDNTGTLVGGTKTDVVKEYAKDLAIGAGAGALVGTIAGPLAGGSVGRGAAMMTAVGAGGGLIKSVWDKGSDVQIPVSASVELVLLQPITVNPSSAQNK